MWIVCKMDMDSDDGVEEQDETGDLLNDYPALPEVVEATINKVLAQLIKAYITNTVKTLRGGRFLEINSATNWTGGAISLRAGNTIENNGVFTVHLELQLAESRD